MPTLAYGVAEREAALHDCDRLAERLLDRPDGLLLVCGDWNGHISREHSDGMCLGDKGMRKHTSVNGRMILARMRGKSYKQVDSFLCCADRGTWTSPDAWHEIDYFVTTQSDRSSFDNLSCVDVGVGDHKMKVVEMHLTTTTRLTRRRQRRAKFAAIEEQRKLRLVARPRLRTDLLAGNSDEAKARAAAGLRPHDAPRRRLRTKISADAHGNMPCRGWTQLAEIAIAAADQIVGREPNRALGAPWSNSDEQHVQRLRGAVYAQRAAYVRLHGTLEATEARQTYRRAQRRWEKAKSTARRKWIRTTCSDLTKAQQRHGMGSLYCLLRSIWVLEGGRSSRGKEYFSIDQMAGHVKSIANDPGEVTRTPLPMACPVATQDWIGLVPGDSEIDMNLHGMKETAAGMDEVTANMLKYAGPSFHMHLLVVQCCWSSDPTTWDSSMHDAFGIFLCKKGDKRCLDNCRCIIIGCTLTRLISRILAKRLMRYLDECGLLLDEQYGFRRNRSVVGLIFTLRVILECAAVAANREAEAGDRYVANMADIRKAYPRTVRAALYDRVAAAGFPPSAQRIIYGLHSLAQYRIRSSESLGAPFQLDRGLKEGDATSCPLFNLFHSNAVAYTMHIMKEEIGDDLGVPMRHFPGLRLGRRPTKASQWHNQPDHPDRLVQMFFADDMNLFHKIRSHQRIERILVDGMRRWGVEVHPGKCERIVNKSADERLPAGVSTSPRFINPWLRGDGKHDGDIAKRRSRGVTLWRKLASQLPRLAGEPSFKGMLIHAAPHERHVFRRRVTLLGVPRSSQHADAPEPYGPRRPLAEDPQDARRQGDHDGCWTPPMS